jgi:HSP20 family protein
MIHNLIQHLATDSGFPSLAARDGFLRADIVEHDKEYVLRIDAPGIKRDALDIQFERGVLAVTAKHRREATTDDAKARFHLAERHHGEFRRSFRMPEGISKEDVAASLDDGVLTVTVTKPDREARAKENAILIN